MWINSISSFVTFEDIFDYDTRTFSKVQTGASIAFLFLSFSAVLTTFGTHNSIECDPSGKVLLSKSVIDSFCLTNKTYTKIK